MTTHDNVTDIVEALHRHAFDDCGGFAGIIDNHVATEAADTIATLRKQLENAREALAIRDKSTEPCPADKRHLGDKLCPKCGSSSAGPCWLKVSADSTFVDSAREALKGQPC